MRQLTVLIGAPGSGKSTLASEYVGVVLSSDAHRAQLSPTGNPNDQDVTQAAMALLRRRLRAHLDAGLPVMVDATNCRAEDRAALLEVARAAGTEQINAVILRTPEHECLARNDARPGPAAGEVYGRRVPEAFIRDCCAAVAAMTPEVLITEGFCRVDVIGSSSLPHLREER